MCHTYYTVQWKNIIAKARDYSKFHSVYDLCTRVYIVRCTELCEINHIVRPLDNCTRVNARYPVPRQGMGKDFDGKCRIKKGCVGVRNSTLQTWRT